MVQNERARRDGCNAPYYDLFRYNFGPVGLYEKKWLLVK